jgi:hypothetical protein
MSTKKNIIPWIISASLAGGLGWTWLNMDGQLARKNAELIELRERYNQLVTEANQKIQDANKRNAELAETANKRNADLAAQANEKIQLANQPEVEVLVSFRKALLSNGNVAKFKSIAGTTIAIQLEIVRASTSASKTVELTIDPGQSVEIGEREGWAFISGDTIKVNQPAHKSLIFNAS